MEADRILDVDVMVAVVEPRWGDEGLPGGIVATVPWWNRGDGSLVESWRLSILSSTSPIDS